MPRPVFSQVIRSLVMEKFVSILTWSKPTDTTFLPEDFMASESQHTGGGSPELRQLIFKKCRPMDEAKSTGLRQAKSAKYAFVKCVGHDHNIRNR